MASCALIVLSLIGSVHAKLSNNEFLLQIDFQSKFTIEDTEKLKQIPDLKALPLLFGYSIQRAQKTFPPFYYPRCEDRQINGKGHISFSFDTNTIRIACQQEFQPMFVVGPLSNVTLSTPSKAKKLTPFQELRGKQYKVPQTVDFVGVKCINYAGRSEMPLNFHQPRFLKKVYEAKTELYKSFSAQKKPMLILFLTPDSFSRRHFFRKLEETVQYLNSVNREKFAAFDYKLHNIIGADTAQNQMRVFGSHLKPEIAGDLNIDYFGADALWDQLSKLGFMTLYGTDACATNTARTFGNSLNVDHVVNQFFCAHYNYGLYRAAKQLLSHQRCIGNHMGHFYLMDYSLSFARQYNKTNLWIYNHFTAAHEMTGQHAQALDRDLKSYIQAYLDEFSESHQVIVLLAGDHGMRYGDYTKDVESIQEHRLPALFVIASHKLLKSIPFSYSNLYTNSQRLTTKPDLRKTMLDLPKVYFGLAETSPSKFFNFFTEEIPADRTCMDAEIPPWFCSTFVPREVKERLFSEPAALDDNQRELLASVQRIASEIVYRINLEVYMTRNMPYGLICKKLSFKRIQRLSITATDSEMIIMRVIFSVNEKVEAVFEAWAIVDDSPPSMFLKIKNPEVSLPLPFLGLKRYLTVRFTKILTIGRLDAYEGGCEKIARQGELNPVFCVCHSDAQGCLYY